MERFSRNMLVAIAVVGFAFAGSTSAFAHPGAGGKGGQAHSGGKPHGSSPHVTKNVKKSLSPKSPHKGPKSSLAHHPKGWHDHSHLHSRFPRLRMPDRHWVHYHVHGIYGVDGVEVVDGVQTADVVPATPIDVETVAVHMIDAGDATQGTGPAYRVTLRNNSDVAIDDVFDLTLAASNSEAIPADAPTATSWIDGMQAGETRDIDIRLPATANTMGPTQNGQATAFSVLSTMADSQSRLVESDKDNNLMVLNRTDIQPVGQE